MEDNGIIYLGENKALKIKMIVHWCRVFKLDYNIAELSKYSIRELQRLKHLARHGEKIIDVIV